MLIMYGIPNCDMIKKAKKILDDKKITYEFVNFKKHIPSEALILKWKAAFKDWPVSKRSKTFLQIEEQFLAANDEERIQLIQHNTSMIKRPILMRDNKVISFGFDQLKLSFQVLQ